MNPRRFSIIVATLALVAAGAFFAFAHARSVAQFAEVVPTMPEPRVRQMLGEPLAVRRDTSGETVFFYGGFQRARWCTMEVYFGPDQQVTRTFHDH